MESNNILCPNCGTDNRNDLKFCYNCGQKLLQNNHVINNQNINYQGTTNNQINNNDSDGTKLGIISLLLYFLGNIFISLLLYFSPANLRDYFSALSGLFPLSGIVVMIIGRIKYPTNKLLKVAMWAIIISFIFSLVVFIIFCIWCYATCTSIDLSGCH